MSQTDHKGQSEFSARHLPLRGLEPPSANRVHLWFLDFEKLGSPLQQGGQGVADRASPRLLRTSRRFYLRLLLGAYLGLPGKDVSLHRAERGKPVLDGAVHESGLQFSLAASEACCLFGFSTSGPVGVDLETRARRAHRPLGLARRYFHPDEAQALERIEGRFLDRAFLHTWACKEAVVKAAGHGIANQLCRFVVSVNPGEPADMLHIEGDDPAAWCLAICHPAPTYLGAVAVRQPQLELDCFSLEPVIRSS
jgi:4'-phosphopantetheinyl transferase